MKKVLVTGFTPFGGEEMNPAYEAVKLLPEKICDAEILKYQISTSFKRGKEEIEKLIEKEKPDVVISVGQAGGRSCLSIERVAVNMADAVIPDNDGAQPKCERLQENGDNAYFSTLPIFKMMENVKAKGLPCYISDTAGTYVCNNVMYHVLYLAANHYPNMQAGFLHVPYSCQQAVNKNPGTPCMSLTDISNSIMYAIEAVLML